jgi:hypothetical protein
MRHGHSGQPAVAPFRLALGVRWAPREGTMMSSKLLDSDRRRLDRALRYRTPGATDGHERILLKCESELESVNWRRHPRHGSRQRGLPQAGDFRQWEDKA